MAKALVLGANILVRAVLGRRVLAILETYADSINFLAPEIAFADVRAHLPEILTKRDLPQEAVTQQIDDVLARLPGLVTPWSHCKSAASAGGAVGFGRALPRRGPAQRRVMARQWGVFDRAVG